MYEKYKRALPKTECTNIKRNLDFLYKTIGNDLKVIHKKADIPILYIVTSYLRRKFVMDGKEKAFRDYIVKFFVEVSQIRAGEKYTESKQQFVEYAEWSKHGLTA
jgi:hypothetical protein